VLHGLAVAKSGRDIHDVYVNVKPDVYVNVKPLPKKFLAPSDTPSGEGA
jgi:hypothetical protein